MTKFETKLTIWEGIDVAMDESRDKGNRNRKVKIEWIVLVMASAIAVLVKLDIITFVPW